MIGKEEKKAILRRIISHQITYCQQMLNQYYETSQASYLDEAIQVSRATLYMTRHSVREPSLLMVLSKPLLHRYVVMGKGADLQEAISTAELAVTTTPEGNPNLPSCIRHLAGALNRVYAAAGSSNYLDHGRGSASVGERFFAIYKRKGVVELLQEAIRLARVAVAATPEDQPERPGRLSDLGAALITRYERFGALGDLREGIRRGEEAVAATPVDHPDRARVLSNLGAFLFIRFGRTGALEDLQQAIRRSEEAVAATPVDHPHRAAVLNNLGNHLSTRFDRTGALEDLQEAIHRSEEAVITTPVGHPDRARWLNNLGQHLSTRFDRTGALEDLQEAIGRSVEAVTATPVHHPDRAAMLSSLGSHLATRFDRTGALEDLQEAIRLDEEALAATPMNHPDRAGRLTNLGNHLSTRFDRTGALEDLQAAIRRSEEAVAATPVDHPGHAMMLSNLAAELATRFDRTGVLEDLHEAIRLLQEAVAAIPVDRPVRAGWLNNLGTYLSARFDRTGALEDLQESIRLNEEAVATTPVDHPNRASMLGSLGTYLSTRFHRTGALEDLQEAIHLSEEAVAATPVDHPVRAVMLSNLGTDLSTLFKQTGVLQDLQEAIRLLEEAVAATPVDHPNRAGILSNLGAYLSTRFERNGALDDLQEAIRCGEEAVAATPVDHPDRSRTLHNLGAHLTARFNRTGALEDLQEAIRRSEEAVATTPADHPDHAKWLSDLGAHLSTRFDRTGALDDLQEAIRRSEEAVAATPVGNPDRARRLNNLGKHLATRFGRTGVLEDLQEAIRQSEDAMAATPADHPDRAGWLNNLGLHLSTRFDRTGALWDLQEAIRLLEEAVAATPVDHPGRGGSLNNLGKCLLARFNQSGNAEDYEGACTAWEMAANCSIAHPIVRAKSARSATLARINFGHLQAAYSNSQSVIKLLHRASSRAIEREDQEYILGQVSGMSSLAASLALETGEPASTAAELLEFGSGIISGYTFDARNDVSELGKEYPGLCSRYKALQGELSSPLQLPDLECLLIPSMTSTGNRITRRLEAIRELDELEAEIRRKEGFSRFQLPPSSTDFMTLARSIGGPIVAFSVSSLRSDAILITETEIKAISLPRLDYNTLREKSSIFSNGVIRGPRKMMPDRLDKFKDILLWLWEAAVEPVLKELNFNQDVSKHYYQPLPRIWWISSGCMGMMPIHAAGDYASNPKVVTSNYVISSYTPTIKSLAYARRKASEVQGRPGHNVLIIGNSLGTSGTSGKGVLSEVHVEVKAIEKIVNGAIGTGACTIPDPPLKKTVLDNLSSCNIAHFACHGVTDPKNPCNSHLLLPNRGGTEADPLRIKDLSNRNLDQSMLAYLSACHTANYTSETLLDEAIHIASGFQLAGFPHVIGTLWEANDLKAREVATEFYKNLFNSLDSGRGFEDGIVSEALHKAVASLSEEFEDNPILWAPFIHIGA